MGEDEFLSASCGGDPVAAGVAAVDVAGIADGQAEVDRAAEGEAACFELVGEDPVDRFARYVDQNWLATAPTT
ncbi:hypothetical protein ACWGI8_32450 [Streptomyces sp. NPDC054841]